MVLTPCSCDGDDDAGDDDDDDELVILNKRVILSGFSLRKLVLCERSMVQESLLIIRCLNRRVSRIVVHHSIHHRFVFGNVTRRAAGAKQYDASKVFPPTASAIPLHAPLRSPSSY